MTGDGVLVRDNRRREIVSKVMDDGDAHDREPGVSVTRAVRAAMRSNYPGSVAEPFDGRDPLIYDSDVGYSRPDQIRAEPGAGRPMEGAAAEGRRSVVTAAIRRHR